LQKYYDSLKISSDFARICSILDERYVKSKVATKHIYLKIKNEKRDLTLQHKIDPLNAHIILNKTNLKREEKHLIGRPKNMLQS
jgi:hypothetical protein